MNLQKPPSPTEVYDNQEKSQECGNPWLKVILRNKKFTWKIVNYWAKLNGYILVPKDDYNPNKD